MNKFLENMPLVINFFTLISCSNVFFPNNILNLLLIMSAIEMIIFEFSSQLEYRQLITIFGLYLMMKKFIAIKHTFYDRIIEMDNVQAELNTQALYCLQIQHALINLSYIPTDNFAILKIVVLIARPQHVIQFPDTSLLSIVLFLIYWSWFIRNIKLKQKQIALIRPLLDTAFFNFIIETADGWGRYLIIIIVSITQISHLFVSDGTLNFRTVNFQNPKQLHINKFLQLLGLLQIIITFDQEFSIVIAVVSSVLFIAKNLNYHHSMRIGKFQIYSNATTIFYVFVHYLHLGEFQFNGDLLIIPFIIMVINRALDRKLYFRHSLNLQSAFAIIKYEMENHDQKIIIQSQYSIENHLIKLDPIKFTEIYNEDCILYASLLLYLNRKLEALQYIQKIRILEKCNYIYKKEHLSYINIRKLEKVQQQCQIKLYSQIDVKQQTIGDTIQNLIKSEEQAAQTQQQIINIIESKIQFYNDAFYGKIQRQKILSLNSKILQFKEYLYQQYKVIGGDKQKSVYCFYLCEILNDYISANEINSVLAVNDDRQNKLLLGQQYLSNKMIYLIIEYNSDLDIIKCSNNIQLLNLQQNLVINKSINILIPQTIQQYHSQLIQKFFVNGTSKYLRKLNNNIYLDQQQNITQVDFGLDIIYQSNNIQFIIFMQQLLNQQYMFLMNQQLFITNVSLNLQQLLSQYQFDLLNKNINQFIHNFDNYLNNEEFINIDNVELIKMKLTVNMQVYIKQINNQPIYYIVYVDTVKTLYKTNTSIQQTVSDRQSVDEDIIIFKPMDMDQQIYEEDKDLSKAIIEMDNTINANKLFSPKGIYSPFIEVNQIPTIQNKIKKPQQQQINLPDQLVDNVDSASNISSLQGIRKSTYYKKYELLKKSQDLNPFSRYHKKFFISFILLLGLQLTLQFIVIYFIIKKQLFSIYDNFTKLVSAVDLLQIKNYVYQPFGEFLCTRWTLFNYNSYYTQGLINYTYWQSLNQFPKSNLDLGYDDFASNINKVLNRQELQKFLEFTYVQIYLYINTAQGDKYNVTLRNSISVFMNFQYTIKMRFVYEGTTVTDSPYVYFTYKNLIPMNLIFVDLSKKVYQDTLYNTENIERFTLTILILMVVLLILFIFITLQYYFQIQKQIYYYINLIKGIDNQFYQTEISRLSILQDKIRNNNDLVVEYVFSLQEKEKLFKNDYQYTKTHKYLREDQIKYQIQYSSLVFVLIFFALSLGVILPYVLSKIFLDLYPNTIELYQKFSDIGSDIPMMFALREILYLRTAFPYYSSSDLNWFLVEIKRSVDSTLQFVNLNFDSSTVIMSKEFNAYLNEIDNNNLCDSLNPDMKNKSLTICPLLMNGNMQRGLKSMLIYMANYIKTDMEVNNLTSRTVSPFLDLEAPFLVSEILKDLNQKFNEDLNNQTVQLLNNLIIICSLLAIFIAFVIVIILTIYRRYIIKEYFYYQRIINIIPRNTILLDDAFERQLRQQLIFENQH